MGTITEAYAPNTPGALEAAQRELDQRNAMAGTQVNPKVGPSGFVPFKQEVNMADSRVHDLRTQTGHLPPQVRAGNVYIPGVGETSIEAARMAGLLPSGFDGPAGANVTAGSPAGDNFSSTDRATQQPQPDALPADIAEAGQLLDTLSVRYGSDYVDGAIWEIANGDDIPTEGIVPGVSQEHIDKVYQGYIAQAEQFMSGTGASVATLQETLTSDELRQARQAAVTGDRTALEHFGKVATQRLELLPSRDPEAFQELVDAMPENERRLLSFDENSQQWVISGTQPIPFATAVRNGWIKVVRG